MSFAKLWGIKSKYINNKRKLILFRFFEQRDTTLLKDTTKLPIKMSIHWPSGQSTKIPNHLDPQYLCECETRYSSSPVTPPPE